MSTPALTINPKLVVFDLFGTLICPGIYRHPFRKLLIWARNNGRQPKSSDARTIMTTPGSVSDIAYSLGIAAPRPLIEEISNDIAYEIEHTSLYSDVVPTLQKLVAMKVDIALCSNLAAPYTGAIARHLTNFSFDLSLSCEVGAVKPEFKIYEHVIGLTSVSRDEVLFVGDTVGADYTGPIEFGFSALHLNRNSPTASGSIQNLTEISYLIQKLCE